MPARIPSLHEIFDGNPFPNGNWVVANVETSIGWPLKVTKVSFRGREIALLPPTRTKTPQPESNALEVPPEERFQRTFPAAATLLAPGEHSDDGQILLSHFLSSLSWVERKGINVAGWSGGNLPRPMGSASRSVIYTTHFYQPYLPDSQDNETRWALAFYREGLALNHVAYGCLSLFKILNIFLRTGPALKDWINNNAPNLTEHNATLRLTTLRATEPNIGQYLWGSNRCAVAHAGGDPTVDPEDPDDIRRLRDDFPLIQALAELAIEQRFGVKSALTVYREHLYELEGFRDIFGIEKIRMMKEGRPIPAPDWPQIPRLSIRLALHRPYAPLENMSAQIEQIGRHGVVVKCTSEDRLTEMTLWLDFHEERLRVDVIAALLSDDDGSAQAMYQAAHAMRFRSDYIGNGILEVFNCESNRLLGRCDAFLPNFETHEQVDEYRSYIETLEHEARVRESRASNSQSR